MASVLGVTTLAAVATWLAVPPRSKRPTPEVSQASPSIRTTPRPSSGLVEDSRQRTALCALVGGLVGWTMLGPVAAVGGVVSGVLLSAWLGRLEPPSVARDRARIAQDLPLVVDLLAACAEVGLPTQAAVAPIGRAVGGPLGARLLDLSARLDLGADPRAVWLRVADDPALAALGHAMVRAHRSGAPVADILSRLSADRRRDLRARGQATARAVGVKVAAPLAACFLPAFMLVGVVPTIIGGLTHLAS